MLEAKRARSARRPLQPQEVPRLLALPHCTRNPALSPRPPNQVNQCLTRRFGMNARNRGMHSLCCEIVPPCARATRALCHPRGRPVSRRIHSVTFGPAFGCHGFRRPPPREVFRDTTNPSRPNPPRAARRGPPTTVSCVVLGNACWHYEPKEMTDRI